MTHKDNSLNISTSGYEELVPEAKSGFGRHKARYEKEEGRM